MSKNRRFLATVAGLVSIVVGMAGLAYASVPLYDLFCKVTGYGGTPQIAEMLPSVVGSREMTIRFNADVNRDLPWEFRPVNGKVMVRVGEPTLVYYRVKNLSDKTIIGTATYNVTPLRAGSYFSKIDCFCFAEQELKPGETVDLPVSFFVETSIESDPSMEGINTVTLSYTFFELEKSVAAGGLKSEMDSLL
ncbi:MAG: cytochrome c oxidase assembly protein [Rhodospirillaceae bacterium]|jgi:cytochrome c oxidase assembly protein subunit 11|nr:cytochrome c oxidase assembly protein [Rhodospirillaceae bacterium]